MNSATQPVAVRVENVCQWFGHQQVLRDISIELRPAETLVIIGESGCGKSVTMKVMMQLIRQSSGDVFWYGQQTTKLGRHDWQRTRLKFGYLFQGAALFDSLTVFDNVAFGLRENGVRDPSDIESTVFRRLEEVGLGKDAAGKRPSELSGGMQKRVGIARALTLDPDVMFYDEPTTGLDPITSRRIDDLIDSVKQIHGVSSVIVTHDMQTVRRVAGRVLMLCPCHELKSDESQIIFEGTVNDLYACQDTRVAAFVRGETGETARPAALAGQMIDAA